MKPAEIVEGDLATKQDLREFERRLIIKMGALTVTIVTLAVVAVIAFIVR